MNKAFEVIHNKAYSLELIFITTHRNAPHIQDLINNTFSFKPGEFSVLHYDDIMQLHSDKMRDFTPHLAAYNLPYKDADKTMVRTGKYKSWVLSVPLQEIRSLVNKHEDKLFRKNVRNFLGGNRCNKGIRETLKNNPNYFWYYNNGICILCDEANLVVENNYIRMVNPQIINGCQTARSIEKFQDDVTGDILVRVIESRDHEFVNAITLYQNTSNPVRKRDLKSNDPIQVRLKSEFKRQHWYYEIKRGEEFGKLSPKYPWMKSYFRSEYWHGYKKVINNEHVAKVLAAIKIGPGIATAKGSEGFFDEFYSNIFTSNISTANCLGPMIIFWQIKNTYGREKFHNFRNGSVFKNPASYYALKYIFDSLNNRHRWERQLVSFWEGPEVKGFSRFSRELARIISEYFEIVYKAWKKSKVADSRSYLQNSETSNEISRNFGNEIKKLSKCVNNTFMKFIGDRI
jgi:hypothetical protein